MPIFVAAITSRSARRKKLKYGAGPNPDLVRSRSLEEMSRILDQLERGAPPVSAPSPVIRSVADSPTRERQTEVARPGGRESPQGNELSFKRRRSFNSRKRDVEEITRRHPHKVPIVVERAKNEKQLSVLDKSKFLVPEELTVCQLTTIIRRRLQLTETQAFYLIVNRRTMVSASISVAEVYRTEKDPDGFLYITYASQEMFG